jgi:hypothetical protein
VPFRFGDMAETFLHHHRQGSWVPAFAGTTKNSARSHAMISRFNFQTANAQGVLRWMRRVSRTRCSVLHDAPQSRDPKTHSIKLGPRISSAPRRKSGALRSIRGTRDSPRAAPDSIFKQQHQDTRSRSRGALRPRFCNEPARKIRGRGERRVPAAPAAPCAR